MQAYTFKQYLRNGSIIPTQVCIDKLFDIAFNEINGRASIKYILYVPEWLHVKLKVLNLYFYGNEVVVNNEVDGFYLCYYSTVDSFVSEVGQHVNRKYIDSL